MPKVFICYRVGDGDQSAANLHRELGRELGEQNVFYASASTPAGTEFRELIFRKVRECDVLIVLIGPYWAGIRDEQGRRKLDNPGDWVREEIRLALTLGKHIIPVLLDATTKLTPESLPADIAKLAGRHWAYFRSAYTGADIDILLRSLRPGRSWPAVAVAGTAIGTAAIVTALVLFLRDGDEPTEVVPRMLREGSVELASAKFPCTTGGIYDKIDFDSGEPGHGKQAQTPCAPPGGLAELILEDHEIHTADIPRFILLPAGTPVRDDATACVDALADPGPLTNRIPLDRLTEGSGLCVRTTEGDVAAVEVTAAPNSGELRLSYTVWQRPDQP